jgi:hypothetical protein
MYPSVSRRVLNEAWFLDNWDLYRSQNSAFLQLWINNAQVNLSINREFPSRTHEPCFHYKNF